MSNLVKIYRWVFLLFLILATETNSFSQPVVKRLLIPSNVPWTDTGIDVPAGSLLMIKATGKVIYWDYNNAEADPNGVNWDGTRFFPNAILPDAVVVSLVGKIGGTTNWGTGTPLPPDLLKNGAGFVGKIYRKIVPESGRLFLGFNDTPNAFGDNIGSFRVSILLSPPWRPAKVAPDISEEPSPESAGPAVINVGVMNASVTSAKSVVIKTAEISSNPIKTVNIGIYAGVQIQDYSNQVCGIQYCTNLSNTNQWQGLTNIVPDSASFIWVDTTKTASSGQRFYRILPGPIPVP